MKILKIFFEVSFAALLLVIITTSSDYSFNYSGSTYSNDSLFNDSIRGFVRDSVLSDENLHIIMSADGKTLYESRCQKCHSLHDPADFNLKEWKRNLKKMKPKAKLDKNEYNRILMYLSENCSK